MQSNMHNLTGGVDMQRISNSHRKDTQQYNYIGSLTNERLKRFDQLS